MRMLAGLLFVLMISEVYGAAAGSAGEVSVADYVSIHEAVKANPGRMLFVPSGDHVIDSKIRLDKDNAGLYGPGRIIQSDTNAPILEIEGAANVRIRDVTLTRSQGRMDTSKEGVLAIRCRDLWIDDLRVLDNRTRSAALALRECRDSRVRGCLIRNYMRISIDDRTAGTHWGYAFNCIDGTGIAVSYSTGTLIQGNRIVEDNLLPTPEIQKRFKLGAFVKKNAVKGSLVSQQTWDAAYVANWHQGSALIVTAPEVCDLTQILGNTIENAAQGIDLHADHVIVSQNIINNAFMGMKAMHGSRNVIITGNHFVKNDLWSIGLMPGAASHPAAPAGDGVKPVAANGDGGSVIANNIISDFGYGNAHWVWGNDHSPFKFDNGQEPDDPPLTDVLITGNVLYDPGREPGPSEPAPPRYQYAVIVSGGDAGPKGLHFSNNLLHPGTVGVANVNLAP